MTEPIHIVEKWESHRRSISQTYAGLWTIVGAPSWGKMIRVLAYTLVASGGANTLTWENEYGVMSGAMDLLDNAQIVCPYNPYGWLQTPKWTSLLLRASSANLVAGHITYCFVDEGI